MNSDLARIVPPQAGAGDRCKPGAEILSSEQLTDEEYQRLCNEVYTAQLNKLPLNGLPPFFVAKAEKQQDEGRLKKLKSRAKNRMETFVRHPKPSR
jgi:hypothetical protein